MVNLDGTRCSVDPSQNNKASALMVIKDSNQGDRCLRLKNWTKYDYKLSL